MLQSTGLQRVGHGLVTEQQQQRQDRDIKGKREGELIMAQVKRGWELEQREAMLA